MPCYIRGCLVSVIILTNQPHSQRISFGNDKATRKTNVLTRLTFSCIFYCLSHKPSFQYNNKLLSQTVVRAVGDTSEKYLISKIYKTLKKVNVTGYFFESMCSLTGHLFRKRAKARKLTKKHVMSPTFFWEWWKYFRSTYSVKYLRITDPDYRNY